MIRHVLFWLVLNVNWNFKEWKWATSWAGWSIFLIVEVPMLLLILAAILGKPRKFKVSAMFIIVMAILAIGYIAVIWIVGSITSLLVP
jgi:hypothetical protein